MKHSQTKGVLLLLGATLCYSSMPLLIRLLDDSGVPPFSQVFLRLVVACFIAIIILSKHSKGLLSKIISKAGIGLLALSVIGYAGSIILLTYAVLYTQVSTALIIFYTFPFITPLFDFLVFKKHPNRIVLYSLILACLGIIFIFQPQNIGLQIGVVFAFGASIAQAYYLVGRRALLSFNAQQVMVTNTFVGSVSMGVIALIRESYVYANDGIVWSLSWQNWAILLFFGAINFFGWYFLSKGFEYISATKGSVIMLSELLFGIVLANVFLAEIPTFLTLLGGLCILCANIVVLRAGEV